MAGIKVVAVVQSNQFKALAKAYPERAGVIVDKAIHDIEDGAARRSRYRTGVMRGGWQARMTGKTSGEVINPVEYTIYNEYGTVHMSAQPMAGPAADEVRPAFVAATAQALKP